MLVEDNLRISSGYSGLGKKEENLRKIRERLLGILRLTEEESNDKYWEWWLESDKEIR